MPDPTKVATKAADKVFSDANDLFNPEFIPPTRFGAFAEAEYIPSSVWLIHPIPIRKFILATALIHGQPVSCPGSVKSSDGGNTPRGTPSYLPCAFQTTLTSVAKESKDEDTDVG